MKKKNIKIPAVLLDHAPYFIPIFNSFVNIFVKGELHEIIIDDNFVVNNNQPCFTKSHDNELWVMILEKAWSKVHGSYS